MSTITTKLMTKLAQLAAWAARRAKERSTYLGVAMILAALGQQELAAKVGHVGDVVALLLGLGGTGLAAATTTPHAAAAPADDADAAA